jgi:serine/threonine protein phosphatase PrpC
MVSALQGWGRRSMKAPVEDLARYAIERGEQDNITVALVRVE